MYKDNLEAAHAQIKRLGDDNRILATENERLREKQKERKKGVPVPMGSVVWLIILSVCMVFNLYQVAVGRAWWLTWVAIILVGMGMIAHVKILITRKQT